LKDKTSIVSSRSKERSDLQKATEYDKQRAALVHQMHQHALQLVTALRSLPAHQAFQRIQMTIERIMKMEAIEDDKRRKYIEDLKRHK
jgi:hypothetical protein